MGLRILLLLLISRSLGRRVTHFPPPTLVPVSFSHAQTFSDFGRQTVLSVPYEDSSGASSMCGAASNLAHSVHAFHPLSGDHGCCSLIPAFYLTTVLAHILRPGARPLRYVTECCRRTFPLCMHASEQVCSHAFHGSSGSSKPSQKGCRR